MRRLTRQEIGDVLREMGYGYLGLAENDRPYVLPMSFGFDGNALYFQMNSSGRKFEFIEQPTPATFTTVQFPQDSSGTKSIIVEGELRTVPENESVDVMEILAENAQFGTDMDLWGDPLQNVALREFQLTPTSLSGRHFQ